MVILGIFYWSILIGLVITLIIATIFMMMIHEDYKEVLTDDFIDPYPYEDEDDYR